MMAEDRHSRAADAELVTDPDEIARLEARNALQQFDTVVELTEMWTAGDRGPFRLRPSTILDLHRTALRGLSSYAGNWRPSTVEIGGSRHQPPAAHLVPIEIENLCDTTNERWSSNSPIELMAYALWRLNWIHPFTDGNGRTARAVAYLILCIRLGYRLPGTNTIPEQISRDKKPYYRSLESADDGDLKPLEELLASLLAKQLYSVHEAATSHGEPKLEDPTLH